MIIPKHEPEVVQAYTKKFGRVDDEKSPTTALKEMVWRDKISVTSRYQKAHEFEEMMRIVDGLPEIVQDAMLGMWCDSQCCAWYEITLDDGLDMLQWKRIVAEIRCYFRAYVGCNGGNIVAQGYPDKEIEVSWPGDEEEVAW